jgi:hypothetical protein
LYSPEPPKTIRSVPKITDLPFTIVVSCFETENPNSGGWLTERMTIRWAKSNCGIKKKSRRTFFTRLSFQVKYQVNFPVLKFV